MNSMLWLFSIGLGALQTCQCASALAEDRVFSDPIMYAENVLADAPSDLSEEKIDISVFDVDSETDKSAITSFSDAFLWTSGIRSQLSEGSSGKLAFIYLDQIEFKLPIRFGDELAQKVYAEHSNIIKNGGSCTSMVVINQEGSARRTFVFIDKRQCLDSRLSCFYRYHKSQFALNPYVQMSDFGSTFTADLRVLRCRKMSPNKRDIIALIKSGRC